jgi:hypothetical protein
MEFLLMKIFGLAQNWLTYILCPPEKKVELVVFTQELSRGARSPERRLKMS